MSYFNGNMLLSTRLTTFTGTQTHGQLDFICRLSAMAPPNVFARGMMGMMNSYDVTHELKTMPVPALILSAKSDRLTKPEAGEFMYNNLPAAQLVTLAPAGHQSIIERHEEGCRAAEAFINGLG